MSFLDRLRELEKAATPGPWGSWIEGPPPKDIDLIVLLRNAAPEFLRLVEAARETVEDWAPEAFEEMPELARLRDSLADLDALEAKG